MKALGLMTVLENETSEHGKEALIKVAPYDAEPSATLAYYDNEAEAREALQKIIDDKKIWHPKGRYWIVEVDLTIRQQITLTKKDTP